MTDLGAFPVATSVRPTFSDDWGLPRAGGRSHQGTDIFAPEGTPVLAVAAGALRFDENTLGGHVAYLTASDATSYYYAHLSGFEGSAPRTVQVGETIGYVGRTGNAARTAPHLHFEIHPEGGAAVDPFPALRAFSSSLPRRTSSGRAAAWVGGSLVAVGALGAALRRAS